MFLPLLFYWPVNQAKAKISTRWWKYIYSSTVAIGDIFRYLGVLLFVRFAQMVSFKQLF